MLAMIVWVLFCFVMWAWAIMMPLLVVGGVAQILFDPAFLNIELGVTPQEQYRTLGTFAGLGAVGLAFAVLRFRGYIRFCDRDG